MFAPRTPHEAKLVVQGQQEIVHAVAEQASRLTAWFARIFTRLVRSAPPPL